MAMQNVKMHVDGCKLLIEVDLSQSLGPSSSGKSDLVALASDEVPDVEGVSVTLSVYRPKRSKRISKDQNLLKSLVLAASNGCLSSPPSTAPTAPSPPSTDKK